MITGTEMPSMHVKNALSGEHRLRLMELLALAQAPVPSSISTKRTAEVVDDPCKRSCHDRDASDL